ncbi:unnamed protein product [Urochloa humidicola]
MDSGSSFLPAGGAASNNGDGAQQQQAPQPMIREQDRLMPIANVIRIMRRVLPPHAKISDDAKETIQECVSEYISFITGEANERCQREQRKTITAEDVLWAMSRLGFDDYVEPLSVYLQRYREFEGEARGVGSLPPPGASSRGGDHLSMAPPPQMLKGARAPPGAMAAPQHHHDMQLHYAASMYGHGGFVMPHHHQGQYLPYPYGDHPAYGGEHAMAAYYGSSAGAAAYAPGNNGGSGDGSGSSGGSAAAHTPQGGGFEHQHPFASYK